ncbi:MAG: L,D-transpeptidase family protein [Kiritimatiellae bacterium]|nr:L,D-transpeptidase family protein [Kiritimatiellia bacterium]
MLINEFDDFNPRKRKPWLLLLILVVLVGVVAHRYIRSDKTGPDAPVEKLSASQPGIEEYVQQPVVPELVRAESKPLPTETPRVRAVSDARSLIASGKSLEAGGALIQARDKYLSVLSQHSRNQRMVALAENALARINIELVTTPRMSPEKKIYVIKRGDIVEKIVRKHKTTVDLFMKSNNLKDPNVIRIGDRMVVFTGKFTVTVSKKKCDLVVFVNNRFFKRYSVGTGKYGRTPAGTFIISDKEKEPVWWRNSKAIPYTGDPEGENILGTRWMTLRATGQTDDIRGYGIHGTWLEDSIGKAESAGCVRMRNKDVEELYMLLPLNTPVTIVD